MAGATGRTRPTYDRAVMEPAVLERLATGMTLDAVCRDLGLARATVWRWTQDDTAFGVAFQQAQREGTFTYRGRTVDITEAELAYAAGFLDGEGCIRIQRGAVQKSGRRYYFTVVQITQTNEDVIRWFQARWKGYAYFNHRNGKNPNAKMASEWKISGTSALAFLRDVYPYLMVKRAQAALMFEYADHVGDPRRNRNRSLAEYDEIQQFYVRSREMNARGVAPISVSLD
jgi:transcriptional regulator with XRE-family HTH domain